MKEYDFIIIGGGIIGLTIAYELLEKNNSYSIVIIDKETDIALHASGRNSGVLHAGFYYSADSMKAKFCKDGSALMREFVRNHHLKINPCGKVVVAQNKGEVLGIKELKRRGDINGVDVSIISTQELQNIEANAKTCEIALLSPTTASVDPKEVCQHLKNLLTQKGVDFKLGYSFIGPTDSGILTNKEKINGRKVINCAGVYADKIAKMYGFGKNYTMMPFKGTYLKYSGKDQPVRMHIYPVPNLKNPFLGVHYTVTVDKKIKIGPTAIPAFAREDYGGFSGINAAEMSEILWYQSKLFLSDSFHFRSLAFEEMKKYNQKYYSKLAEELVHKIDSTKFNIKVPPGIRAQLLNKNTLELVQDFVIEKDDKTLHVLNSVSPAFTCSFALAKQIVSEF